MPAIGGFAPAQPVLSSDPEARVLQLEQLVDQFRLGDEEQTAFVSRLDNVEQRLESLVKSLDASGPGLSDTCHRLKIASSTVDQLLELRTETDGSQPPARVQRTLVDSFILPRDAAGPGGPVSDLDRVVEGLAEVAKHSDAVMDAAAPLAICQQHLEVEELAHNVAFLRETTQALDQAILASLDRYTSLVRHSPGSPLFRQCPLPGPSGA
ncbi:hypothetical protein, variant [Fonticula alba]|uniref:Uncharacterized protein n=1 Tax=Fonticula alba TaxID=691883 RepID=A0A058ZG16_FONAL|nr:hypothetical protein, variant [Fonticula alba]KCV72868.1 hypothetical protein, variant [Fonticula alba]|eukprot:XP_009492569.1 hypothetical protein, variant [Fonticula alba]